MSLCDERKGQEKRSRTPALRHVFEFFRRRTDLAGLENFDQELWGSIRLVRGIWRKERQLTT